MNFDKNPKQAVRLAKEQKRLRKLARQNPERLDGRERAMAEWDIEFENYTEQSDNDHRTNDEQAYGEPY